MSARRAIGVFDSGLGGLSVAAEIRRLLRAEDLLYFADSAYCPYGGRPLEQISARTLAIGEHLAGQGVKALVVACNTASGAALEALRASLDIPIVGLEPALKPAVLGSRRQRVGVMATAATLQTERFDRLVRTHANGAQVVVQACPGLVELVERGATGGEEARTHLRELLRPFVEHEVDAVVLGCTHYPFLRPAIGSILGPGVRIHDSGGAVARQVRRVLARRGELEAGCVGGIRLLTTGDPARVGPVANLLWGTALPAEGAELPPWPGT
jgi:glutamate racemase